MRKILLITGMAGMLGIGLAAIAMADTSSAPGKICLGLAPSLGISQDACATCLLAEDGDHPSVVAANCICKENESIGNHEFANHGACVNYVRNIAP